MKTVQVPVSAIVGSGFCVNTEDAHRVYEFIYQQLKAGNRIEISFSGITRMTTAFLNVAVGQLYGEFSEEQMRIHMAPPVDTEPWQLSRLKLVVDRAKIFFKNREEVESINRKYTNIDE